MNPIKSGTVGQRVLADAAFAALIETVWACERWEREHPFTVGTIRQLALSAPLAYRQQSRSYQTALLEQTRATQHNS
jgi:hypothetical protein